MSADYQQAPYAAGNNNGNYNYQSNNNPQNNTVGYGNEQNYNAQNQNVGYNQQQNYNPQTPNAGYSANPQPVAGAGFEPESIGTKLTENTRIGFIRKVYSILAVQLLITVGGVVAIFNMKGVYNFVFQNIALLFISMAIYIVCIIVLGCFRSVSRRVPINYILLLLLTLAMTYMV